jgi:pimeloyl-ACP methyl ester carboxylesterase
MRKIALYLISLISLTSLMSSCSSGLQVHSSRDQFRAIGDAPNPKNQQDENIRQTLKVATHKTANPSEALAAYLHTLKLLDSSKQASHWHTEASTLALSNAIELAQSHALWNTSLSYQDHNYQLTKQSNNSFLYDTLEASAKYGCKSCKPVLQSKGKGVGLTASYSWTAERDRRDPFIPHIGYHYPLNAQAQWIGDTELRISLHAPDSDQTLSANYAAPLCIVEHDTHALNRSGIRGVFRPQNDEQAGLFSHEPVDPNKTSVILVHGLASSPTLWLDPMYQLMHDPKIRAHYQFYAYYYPTGLPIAYNAANLKLQIQTLHQTLKQAGAGTNADNMILIGHSMGGVISSILTRDLSGSADQFFKIDPESVEMTARSKRAILTLFDQAPLQCIDRAIFIAAPHRGSKLANNWYGQLASNLIEIPNSLIRTNSDEYINNLSDLGRSILPSRADLDGVKRLEYRNPGLMFIVGRNKVPRVKYHSIIGNRGRKGELSISSDGVVPYSSSHLENVESEHIVPSGHSAQSHPQAISEMARILRLDLP